jgi:Phosphoesterase family
MPLRKAIVAVVLSAPVGTSSTSAQFPVPSPPPFPPQIKRVVVVFQENRTPDNLFHFLTPACPLPVNPSPLEACTPEQVTNSCYNISPCGLSNQSGTITPVTLKAYPIGGTVDPDHSHNGFNNMCDPDPATQQCRVDGAWKTSSPAGSSYAYVQNTGVTNSDGSSGHLLDPYLTMVKNYGWANFMYQTNQGPSYPAHQFMFSGTSAMTADDDANSTFVSENFNNKVVSNNAGCLALEGATNDILSPVVSTPADTCKLYSDGSVQECTVSNTVLVYPSQPVGTFCVQHQSMADILDPHSITWKYYAPSAGSIWTAPDAIKAICEPQFVNPSGNPSSQLQCTGKEWNANVDVNDLGTDILRDIANCNLAKVVWVIPDGQWSDHPPNDLYGPSWVAAVVNAIGNNPRCSQGTADAGETYWNDTAIIVTWDDWGGWSDHEPAPYASALPCTSTNCQGDYQHGFRVPMVVVSAYTPAGYINNVPHDFGSVLRMIEGVNHLPEGALGFADKRATTDLRDFFTLPFPRNYQTIPAQKEASFFLMQNRPASDPDDD